jgi:schlafen family protein
VSIFTKALSQLTTADLQELLDDGAVENVRLEFKSEVPGKDETLKKLSAFANTFGGYIVVGARASSSDARVESLPGVDAQPGYRQTIVQWCFGGASPPLIAEVSDPIPTPAGDSKICYVIYTSESDIAPHFLNGRKGVYVRTDEVSSRFEARFADENEFRHLLDRRKLIQERRIRLLQRANRRFQRYAVRRAEELAAKVNPGERERKLGASMTLSVVPRFPAKPILEQAKLAPLIKQNTLQWHMGTFPKLFNPMISQHESTIVLQPGAEFSIFETNIWGMLFYGTQLESVTRGLAGIHLHHLAGCVLLFLRHSSIMLGAMGYSGPIMIEVTLASMLDVPWLYDDQGFADFREGSVLDDAADFAIEATTHALQEAPDGVAKEVLQYVLFSANWSERVDSPAKVATLLSAGYRYSGWDVPELPN